MGEPKRMSPEEFRDLGYLQEVNRIFLHPLGLALEVVVAEDGSKMSPSGSSRQSQTPPNRTEVIDREKAERITAETATRYGTRFDALGFWQQPAD